MKKRKKRKKPSTDTPVRVALVPKSSLISRVQNGLRAINRKHHSFIDEDLRAEFGDSIDIDEAFRAGHEQDNRWDYLLGHTLSMTVVGLEPHSAKDDQISTIIAKRTAAKVQLRSHLKSNASIAAWLWVASGTVRFADTEKARRRLDQNGIRFVGTIVKRKHLPADASGS